MLSVHFGLQFSFLVLLFLLDDSNNVYFWTIAGSWGVLPQVVIIIDNSFGVGDLAGGHNRPLRQHVL